MRGLLALSLAFIAISPLVPYLSWAEDKMPEAFVYVLDVKGKVTYQTEGTPKISQQVRRMEPISPGTILYIDAGAEISLTCPGGKVLSLRQQDNPYLVKMGDFIQDQSITQERLRYLLLALKHFIYPASQLGLTANLRARGGRFCVGLWPEDDIKIIGLGKSVTFSWPSRKGEASFQIDEIPEDTIIFLARTASNSIRVPVDIFRPGMRYRWLLDKEIPNRTCEATFVLIPVEEAKGIKRVLADLPSLLPPQIDPETIRRLQAGYLLSIGLNYDAWEWLRLMGIFQ